MQGNCFSQSSDRFTDIETAPGQLMKQTASSPFSCPPTSMAVQTHASNGWDFEASYSVYLHRRDLFAHLCAVAGTVLAA